MDILITIFIAVVAGVLTHIICKWLDSNERR